MLILTRKPGERIRIGDDIIVEINEIKGNQTKVAIFAPKHIKIMREEIIDNDKYKDFKLKPLC